MSGSKWGRKWGRKFLSYLLHEVVARIKEIVDALALQKSLNVGWAHTHTHDWSLTAMSRIIMKFCPFSSCTFLPQLVYLYVFFNGILHMSPKVSFCLQFLSSTVYFPLYCHINLNPLLIISSLTLKPLITPCYLLNQVQTPWPGIQEPL